MGVGVMLAACGGGGDSTGDGTETGTGTDPTTGPGTMTVSTTADTSGPTGPTGSPTTNVDTSTGTDPDTSSTGGESSSTGDDTGGPVVPPCPYEAVEAPTGFALEVVGEDLNDPVFALGHPTEPDRLFVVELGGAIRMIEPGTTTPVETDILFLDDVQSGSESGLFGLAFHPDFPDDPRIYLNYTQQPNNRTRIVEYTLDPANGYVGDPSSARTILALHQPAFNHNGGGIAFDTTGHLVIGMGDGGPQASARNSGVLLSKFLRIGVEPDGNEDDPLACEDCPSYGPFDYTIPDDNPFAVDDGVHAPEIFALGFRNPWRWSIDVVTGDIWVGDVGQSAREEVSLVEAGRDYGWNDMEGFACFGGGCNPAGPNQTNADGLTMPIVDIAYSPGSSCSVIGGAVYRSCEVPEWDGVYTYTDYCSPNVRALRWDGNEVEDLDVVIVTNGGLVGNGWNNWGDVYFTGGGEFTGRVWRLVPTVD